MKETTSNFNAGVSLKFTPTEALGLCKSRQKGCLEEAEVPENNTSQVNAEGSFRFTYSKNEIYQLFLSHSSKKVRLNTSCGEYNGMFCKVIKPLLLSLSV